jgi:hypothetical protein
MLSNLEIDKNESKTVQTFKNILESNVEKYLKIHFIHKFALVFDRKRFKIFERKRQESFERKYEISFNTSSN